VGLIPATLFQSKLASYSSYAVGGWVPRGTLLEALFWDDGDPYDYLRVDRRHDHDFIIFGGEDHKTGQVENTSQCFTKLEHRVKSLLPDISVTHRWSGQVIETNDGLPYIGEVAERQYAATGFAGNGMTYGTLAAMMFRDYVTDRKNPWAELYDTGRTKIVGGLWDYLKENKDYPYYLVRDRFAGAGSKSVRRIKRGTGEVIEVDGQPAAAYRGLDGQIYVRSAVCTHMGCYVHWNDAERTWDCPCHGSRFKTNGEVSAGPAEAPLAEIKIPVKKV
jgi:Rieske Fe-S protein